MNAADTIIIELLALVSLALLIYLRRGSIRVRARRRVMRGLRVAVQREGAARVFTPSAKPWSLQRAC